MTLQPLPVSQVAALRDRVRRIFAVCPVAGKTVPAQ